jgi:hypothetical protein
MTKFGLSKERRPFECGKNSDEKAVVKSRWSVMRLLSGFNCILLSECCLLLVDLFDLDTNLGRGA